VAAAAVVVGTVVIVATGSDLGCFTLQKVKQKVKGMMGEGVMAVYDIPKGLSNSTALRVCRTQFTITT
jgi:hypothetical protein